jgi:D-hexose-6-phosphate mutarotase
MPVCRQDDRRGHPHPRRPVDLHRRDRRRHHLHRPVDPVLGRTITVTQQGAGNVVVWNPWADKAAAMADFGDDEWPGMACVETANAFDNARIVEPGASYAMTSTISVRRDR